MHLKQGESQHPNIIDLGDLRVPRDSATVVDNRPRAVSVPAEHILGNRDTDSLASGGVFRVVEHHEGVTQRAFQVLDDITLV